MLKTGLHILELSAYRKILLVEVLKSFHQLFSLCRCGDFAYRVNHTPMLPIPLDNVTTTSPNLTETELDMLKDMESTLYRQMVVKRNRKMAQRIESLLEVNRNHTYFLGLGAGHYLSEKNSVIDRLRRKGYKVEHIPASQAIDGYVPEGSYIQIPPPPPS